MKAPTEVVTFGCRLNAYESAVIKQHGILAGWTDTVIVNTCAVTAEAERQARQAIRRLRRERPDVRIVVTGCAAQIAPATYSAMPEVDQVIGNSEKMAADTYAIPPAARIVVSDIMALTETAPHLVAGFDGRSRAFVEIQQGCDHRCTFCIIPYGRGNNRSVPMARIISQIRDLVAEGFREVVLTGVDITGYGGDIAGGPNLGGIVQRILAEVPELPRLRLSSLDPVEVDDALLGAVASEPRLMPHFHLSVQAGDDTILKRMKRRHGRNDVIALANRLRQLRPDVALGADMIAGFPTETEAMFAESLALVDDAGLTHLHIFPYSARPGTPAARMPPVAGPLIKERAARLRAKGEIVLQAFRRGRIGRRATIVVEQTRLGHCEHYLPVHLDADAVPGDLADVMITGESAQGLTGTRIDD